MKTKLELIKNYPIEALKNWGDYFGYPEAVCKNMVDMADVTDWQSAKIAVLDDFGFQMINYLIKIKNVPLQNIYFLVSEEDEVKVELMRKWYSNFLENTILQTYNIDMSFDLIIANPPYGKSSSLSRKIVNKMLESRVAKEMIVLAPPKTFYDNLSFVTDKLDIGLTSDHFDIPVANGVKVFICKMILDKKSDETWEHFLLSEKELMYLKVVENYNKNKAYSFETPGWITTRAKSKGIFKDIDESRIVLFGIYYPKYLSTGWLQSSGEAEEHNLRGKAIRYHDSSSAPWALVFKTQEEAKGFCNFYYKGVEENKAGKVFTFGFSILRKLYGDDPSSKKYQMILPALDWSKSWTDAEILKEIGLPEDFLEKK